MAKNELDISKGLLMINPNTSLTHLRGVMKRLVDCPSVKNLKGLVVKNTTENRKIIKMINDLKLTGMPTIIMIGQKIKEISDKHQRKIIINDFHMLPTAGHAGMKRTLNTIKQRYHWKTMDHDVAEFIKKCDKCQRNKSSRTKIPETITSTASSAFEKIFLDLVGPLQPDTLGNQYILTTQCDLTKFITATPIKDKSTDTVAKAFMETVILNYGVPNQILTDRIHVLCIYKSV